MKLNLLSMLALLGTASIFSDTAHSQWQHKQHPLRFGNQEANIFQETDTPTLHLFGSGLENRQTSERLALVCVQFLPNSQSCSHAQFVYFSRPWAKPKLLGRFPFEVRTTDADVSFLKAIDSSYAAYRKKKSDNSSFERVGGPIVITGASSIVILATAGAISAGTFGLGGLGVMIVAGVATRHDHKGTSFLGSEIPLVTTQFDQRGWNWSSDPKKISDKRFQNFRTFIDQLLNWMKWHDSGDLKWAQLSQYEYPEDYFIIPKSL